MSSHTYIALFGCLSFGCLSFGCLVLGVSACQPNQQVAGRWEGLVTLPSGENPFEELGQGALDEEIVVEIAAIGWDLRGRMDLLEFRLGSEWNLLQGQGNLWDFSTQLSSPDPRWQTGLCPEVGAERLEVVLEGQAVLDLHPPVWQGEVVISLEGISSPVCFFEESRAGHGTFELQQVN